MAVARCEQIPLVPGVFPGAICKVNPLVPGVFPGATYEMNPLVSGAPEGLARASCELNALVSGASFCLRAVSDAYPPAHTLQAGASRHIIYLYWFEGRLAGLRF